MIKEFASPSSYVQGKGVLFKSDPYLKGFGKKPLLLTDDSVYGIVGNKLENYLKDNGYDFRYLRSRWWKNERFC